MRHLRALLAGKDLFGILPRIAVKRLPLRLQLPELQNCRIEHHDRVPGRPAHDPVDGQRENGLEGLDGILRRLAEDGVDRDLRDGRIVLRDAVERDLQKRHVDADIAPPHGAAGVGFLQILHGRVRHDLHILSIIPPEDPDGIRARLRQLLRAPLAEPVAGGGDTVAEFGRQRLDIALPAQIIGEQLVDERGDVLIDVAAVDEFLIDRGRGRDVEGIAAAAVVLRIDAVERERDDGQRVGPQRGRFPGRVDLAGKHVFDIVGKRDRDVFCARVRCAEVDRDGFGDVRNDRGHTLTAPARECRIPAFRHSSPAASASG